MLFRTLVFRMLFILKRIFGIAESDGKSQSRLVVQGTLSVGLSLHHKCIDILAMLKRFTKRQTDGLSSRNLLAYPGLDTESSGRDAIWLIAQGTRKTVQSFRLGTVKNEY